MAKKRPPGRPSLPLYRKKTNLSLSIDRDLLAEVRDYLARQPLRVTLTAFFEVAARDKLHHLRS